MIRGLVLGTCAVDSCPEAISKRMADSQESRYVFIERKLKDVETFFKEGIVLFMNLLYCRTITAREVREQAQYSVHQLFL
jgi:hypothetical protein